MRICISILVMFFALAVSMCSPRRNCITPPSPVLIRLVNSANKDLLNPAFMGSYNSNDIHLSYIENGVTKELPVSVLKAASTDSFFLSTDIAWYADKGRTFYVKLSATDTDTLFAQVDRTADDDCTFYITKEFRYNGIAMQPKQLVPNYPFVYEWVK